MRMTVDRHDVESFAQMLLAAVTGRYWRGHGEGASDAAFGRVYGHSRSSFTDRTEYDLGYRVGRYVRFMRLPQWRVPLLTHSDAAEDWAKFLASPEARQGDPA